MAAVPPAGNAFVEQSVPNAAAPRHPYTLNQMLHHLRGNHPQVQAFLARLNTNLKFEHHLVHERFQRWCALNPDVVVDLRRLSLLRIHSRDHHIDFDNAEFQQWVTDELLRTSNYSVDPTLSSYQKRCAERDHARAERDEARRDRDKYYDAYVTQRRITDTLEQKMKEAAQRIEELTAKKEDVSAAMATLGIQPKGEAAVKVESNDGEEEGKEFDGDEDEDENDPVEQLKYEIEKLKIELEFARKSETIALERVYALENAAAAHRPRPSPRVSPESSPLVGRSRTLSNDVIRPATVSSSATPVAASNNEQLESKTNNK